MYFFCDIDGLDPQSAGQNFGPVTGSPNTSFRVTSLHDILVSNSSAIAVCEGEVVIVPMLIPDDASPSGFSNSATLVNLILKPEEQPVEVGLPSVRYYIYKGIKRDTLVDGSDVAAKTKNDLTNIIWKSQGKKNEGFDISNLNPFDTTNDSNSPPPASALLVDVGDVIGGTALLETDPLYRLFFRDGTDPADSQFSKVKEGWHIGDFTDAEEVGFEIIVDQIGFEPDLTHAKMKENFITATVLPATPNQAQNFSHWNEKEKILSFLDPCAFFGSFYDSKLKAKKGVLNKTYNTIKEIYENLLDNKFLNKNRVYVDIRNGLEYSYNYNKNYAYGVYAGIVAVNNIYIDTAESNYDAPDYTLDMAGVNIMPFVDYDQYGVDWPILTFETADFIDSDDSINDRLSIQMAFPRVDNPNPILLLLQGEYEKKSSLGKRVKEQHQILQFPNNLNISAVVKLLAPNYLAPSDPTIEPHSCYIRLKYLKELPQCKEENSAFVQRLPNDTTLRGFFDLENIFTPFDMTIPWLDPDLNDGLSWVYNNEVFVDAMRSSGQSFLAKSGIARDANGDITLFAFATERIISNATSDNEAFSLVGRQSKVDNSSYLQRIAGDFNFALNTIQAIDYTGVPTGISAESLGNVSAAELSGFDSFNPSDFSFITISATNFTTMKGVVDGTVNIVGNVVQYDVGNNPIINGSAIPPFLPGYKVHLGLELVPPPPGAPAGLCGAAAGGAIRFHQYRFVLRGYAYGSDGADSTVIEIRTIETGIDYYRTHRSIDYTTLLASTADSTVQNPILMTGRGYSIDSSLGATSSIAYPDGSFPLSPIPIRKIISKVYLYRGQGVTPDQFCDYMNYWRINVQQVWDTTSNAGLVTTYSPYIETTGLSPIAFPTPLTPNLTPWNRPFIVDGSGIEVREASATQFSRLRDNEVLMFVIGGGGRANIIGNTNTNRRVGEFYYATPTSTNPYVPVVENIPAHEFGHILGLEDRYVVPAFCHKDFNYANDKDIVVSPPNPPITNLSNVMARYISSEDEDKYDGNYSQRYNWVHNLMSTTRNVRSTGDSLRPVELEESFIILHQAIRPVPNVINADWSSYSRITVFVTPEQFDLVLEHNNPQESIPIYFKNIKADGVSGDLTYVGTFIGEKENGDGSFDYFTDDAVHTPLPIQNYISFHDWQGLGLGLFNDFDHRMEERMKIQPGGTYVIPQYDDGNDPRRLMILGHVIPQVNLSFDLNLNAINNTNPSPTLFELEFGGNVYGTNGINSIRNDMYNSFLESVKDWDLNGAPDYDIPLATGNPATPLNIANGVTTVFLTAARNRVRALHNKINVVNPINQNLAQFESDNYSDSAIGNAYGLELWNQSIFTTDLGSEDELRNLISTWNLPCVQNILPNMVGNPAVSNGQVAKRPYLDYQFYLGALGGSLSGTINNDNQGLIIYDMYTLKHLILFNRRAIMSYFVGIPIA